MRLTNKLKAREVEDQSEWSTELLIYANEGEFDQSELISEEQIIGLANHVSSKESANQREAMRENMQF